MKRILFTGLLFLGLQMQAQVMTPAFSQRAEISQIFGLTKVTVDYGRPAKKGRIVFGELVPFGKVWRTGANANTIISFADDVEIENQKLAKGSYALYSIPKADSWEIIFYKTTDNWGTPQDWDENNIALKVNVTPENLANEVEFFTIESQAVNQNSGKLNLKWDRTQISLNIKVPTHEKVMESIEKSFAQETTYKPKPYDYFAASQYLYNNNIDLTKSLNYINECEELLKDKIPVYVLFHKALVLEKVGKTSEALALGKKSLELAEKTNNTEYLSSIKKFLQNLSK